MWNSSLKLFPSSKIDFWPFLKLQKMEFGLQKIAWNWFIWFHEFFWHGLIIIIWPTMYLLHYLSIFGLLWTQRSKAASWFGMSMLAQGWVSRDGSDIMLVNGIKVDAKVLFWKIGWLILAMDSVIDRKKHLAISNITINLTKLCLSLNFL